MRRLYYLHKVESTEVRSYLHELIPPIQGSHRNPVCLQGNIFRADLFTNSFSHFSISEWNRSSPDIKSLRSHVMFRKKLSTFIWPSEKRICSIYDPQVSTNLPNTSSDIISLILWIRYFHALLKLEAKTFFYATKFM